MFSLPGSNGSGGWLVGSLLLLAGVLVPLFVITSKLVLYQDRIEQSSAFGQRELYRRDIDGFRKRVVKNSTLIDLIARHSAQKKMTVIKRYAEDPQFVVWLSDIRNLDEIDELAAKKVIEQDIELGATPEERTETLKKWRRILNIAGYSYIAASVGLFFLPVKPFWLTVFLLSGPWICVALLAKSRHFTLIELDKVSLLRKLNLQPLMIFSSVSFYMVLLGIRPEIATFPLHWQKPFVLALLGGLLMLVVVISFSRGAKLTWVGVFGVLPSLIVYAGGSSILLNTELDHKDAASYRLVVVNKYMTTGKGAANYLVVGTTDETYRGDTSFKVARSIYDTTPKGAIVCVTIHPGALYMPWESLVACDAH